MKTLLLTTTLVAVMLLSACTRPDEARRVLRNAGYTNVEITGYRFFMGDKNDLFVTGFKAISPNGQQVTGAVTSGFLKGATIRFD